MDLEEYDVPEQYEQDFYDVIRRWIISLFLYAILYLCCYVIISRFRRPYSEDFIENDEDDVFVYKISLWLCTFSLAVSVCAALLLPISVIANEVLLLYPKSYYIKWLNHSLIQGLWNLEYLSSNVSLFLFLPFAYFFTESEGFYGQRKGIKARLYETCVSMLLLYAFLIGLCYVFSAISQKIYNLDLKNYLSYVYSCMSFVGVVMLLVCTPLGFTHLFTVASQFLTKPNLFKSLVKDDYMELILEEQCIVRRLAKVSETGLFYSSPVPLFMPADSDVNRHQDACDDELLALKNGNLRGVLMERLRHTREQIQNFESHEKSFGLSQNFLYPLGMLVLLIFTGVSICVVCLNIVQLLIGMKSLPITFTSEFTLGLKSLSILGPFGASLEVVLISYLLVTSIIGLYKLPYLHRIQPHHKETPFNHVILNCALLLVLTSVLPLISKILGFTNFHLLGDFGRIEWLGDFYLILASNVVFVTTAVMSLTNIITKKVKNEIFKRIRNLNYGIFSLKGRQRVDSTKDE